MAYCAKCGKETKDGQIYCESCLAMMEDNSYDDLFQSLNEKEDEDNIAEDDFNKILEDLQGPREDIDEPKEKKDKKAGAPSTVSDVFSDAVSAISSLEDELGDMVDLGKTEDQKEQKKKKQSFLQRLFHRNSKQEDTQADLVKDAADNHQDTETKQDSKALKKAKKLEEKKAKEEAKAAKKKAAEQSKSKAKTKSAKSEAGSGDEDPKKAKAKKAESKKAKKEKPKKEKVKKEKKKPDAEEVIVEEDIGHFNIPVMVIVFAVFVLGTGYILIRSLTTSYNYSIEVASRKFENQKYNQAYEEIYGLDVKKDDEELYDKIMTVMYVNKQLNSYNNYMGLDMYPEALDSLIKGLKRYDKYIDAAKELGITDDLDYVRGQILKVLKKEFGLSEKKAMKLTKIDDQSKYSIEIYDIVIENTDYTKKK